MKLAGNDSIVRSDSFEGFEGFEGASENEKHDFRPEAIPGLAPFIHAVAESLQVSYGMIAPAVLSVVSLSIVKKFVIHMEGDHNEPPNLYFAIIAEASERKSPTMKQVTKPVYDYEREENERRQPEISRYQAKKKILENKLNALMKRTGKKDSLLNEEDIFQAQEELDKLKENAVEPVTIIADDTTVESLSKLMSDNHERMAIMSTEGGLFGNIAGRYSEHSNMDIYLKGYSGDPMSVNRIGRKGESMSEPLLSVLIYVQPVVIEQVMENKEFTGRGLLARFLYTRPPSLIGKRKYHVNPIPEYRKDELCNVVNRLLNIPIPVTPTVVECGEEANRLAESYHYEVERELLNTHSPELRAWVGKLLGNTMRIALTLHCIKHLEESGNHLIDVETMKEAIEIGHYFLVETKRVYASCGLADSQEVRDAKYILQKIEATGKTEMKLRDLQQMCKDRVGMEKKEGIISGINYLTKLGFIRVQRVNLPPQNPQNPQKGGRPSDVIYVNPEYIKRKSEKN